MAAPTYVNASTGSTDTTGPWTHTGVAAAVGNLVILHIIQHGSTNNAISITSITAGRRVALDGTADTVTLINPYVVGGASEARAYLWIGRSVNSAAPVYSGGNTTSEDPYIREYEFTNVSTGTTLATVIENATAGTDTAGLGTSTTVADVGVTTLGVDRLALNLVCANGATAIAAFTGQSGGTWVEAVAEFSSASGLAGMLQLQTAAMASPGTIDGGTATITSLPWAVVGFALIGTTVTSTQVPRTNTMPSLLAQ